MTSFDLISDLHVDVLDPVPRFSDRFPDFQPSQVCVVAGDLVADRGYLVTALESLRAVYDMVIYVDGNSEHRGYPGSLAQSYQDLSDTLQKIPGVAYLYDNMVIINDVAFVGTNGWYSFNADSRYSYQQATDIVAQRIPNASEACDQMLIQSIVDSRYLENSLARIQRYPDVRRVILVTHTVPWTSLIQDQGLVNSARINLTVNTALPKCLDQDTENKVCLWCFGHLHESVDQRHLGLRYVCNPRGRPGTAWFDADYRPRRIDL